MKPTIKISNIFVHMLSGRYPTIKYKNIDNDVLMKELCEFYDKVIPAMEHIDYLVYIPWGEFFDVLVLLGEHDIYKASENDLLNMFLKPSLDRTQIRRILLYVWQHKSYTEDFKIEILDTAMRVSGYIDHGWDEMRIWFTHQLPHDKKFINQTFSRAIAKKNLLNY